MYSAFSHIFTHQVLNCSCFLKPSRKLHIKKTTDYRCTLYTVQPLCTIVNYFCDPLFFLKGRVNRIHITLVNETIHMVFLFGQVSVNEIGPVQFSQLTLSLVAGPGPAAVVSTSELEPEVRRREAPGGPGFASFVAMYYPTSSPCRPPLLCTHSFSVSLTFSCKAGQAGQQLVHRVLTSLTKYNILKTSLQVCT